MAAAAAAPSEIREGAARLLIANGQVFYNNVQAVNRDLSVVALGTFIEQLALERETKEADRIAGAQGWRKPNLTWDTWGKPDPKPVVAAAAAAAASAGGDDKPEEDDDEADNADGRRKSAEDGTPAEPADNRVRILEALAASGLRSIRYAHEVAPKIPKVIVANDFSEMAAESIRVHSASNGPYPPGTTIEANQGDAVEFMIQRRRDRPFHVVDIDPYGAPTPFLDAAVQCVEDNGLLCITATDLAVLCGAQPEKCHAKYGSTPALHKPYCHEMAIRILLSTIEAHANRHGRHIIPLLSLKLDFYVRVFVRVSRSAAQVRTSMTRVGYVAQSARCDSFFMLPHEQSDRKMHPARLTMSQCPQSGGDMLLVGPLWNAPIHNAAFIRACLARIQERNSAMRLVHGPRVSGVLAAALQELPDVALYYRVDSISKSLHCSVPPMQKVQAAIVNAGYRVSQTHDEPMAIKTDAPDHVIWDIWRCWIKRHPVSAEKVDKDPVAKAILSREPALQANFDPPQSVRETFTKKRARPTSNSPPRAKWALNPEPNWGPKSSAPRR